MSNASGPITAEDPPTATHPACVLVFNANDPSGAGGLAADVTAIASVGAHALPVMTGVYARDSAQIFDHFLLDDEAVTEQARAVLEDISVQVIKVGFVGSADNLGVVAGIAADYSDLPLVAYMPDLSWWDEVQIDLYLDAFKELLLPQTTVLVGNHSTLWRWLLPDWSIERSPSARDLARAAHEHGVSFTLVTGIPLPDQFIDNVLSSPLAVLASEKFERFEATFTGAGDTLSAALAALLASGDDLTEAFTEALSYLDRSLEGGFRPGMGHIVPDRLFWAQTDDAPQADAGEPVVDDSSFFSIPTLELPPNDTKH
jgi:hydroxymethylpyrimidine/phosphomethylpyrimidine kinase